MRITKRLIAVYVCILVSALAASAENGDGSDPCASLTPANLQEVIDVIAQSRTKAQSDTAANGVTGAYAIAAAYNLDYLQDAYDKMLALQTWLQTNGLDWPYVTNVSAAYSVHGYVREAVVSLHYARHWAMISVVYHKSADAKDSYELTSQTLNLIEPLGAQAGRCYMQAYF
jgi:hypothetical protein